MASALELIANEIRHCHSCPLHKSRHRAVPGVGPASADILLLGEGPGQKEDQTGLPFCGPAGSFLGELISSLGVDRRRLFVSNVVRCLGRDTMVYLATGETLRIDMLVKHQHPGPVLTVDRHGEITTKAVVGWYRTSLESRQVYKVTHSLAKMTGKGPYRLQATGDHEVLTDGGWLTIDELLETPSALICTGLQGLGQHQRQLLLATILSDGHVTGGTAATFHHNQQQLGYLEAKRQLLSSFAPTPIRQTSHTYETYSFRVPAMRALLPSSSLRPEEIVAEFDDFGLACWFMNDGHTRFREDHLPRAEIATTRFSQRTVRAMVKEICKKGIYPYEHRGRVYFDVEETTSLLRRLAPHFVDCMQYKLPVEFRANGAASWKPEKGALLYAKPVIAPIDILHMRSVYCIDVADTHNFITPGGVVHNCRPPNNRDPMLAEIAACSTWTQAQIDILNPKLIVTLGRFAAETYFHGLPMKQVHGCLTRTDGILVFGSYHPAAALHQPALRDQIKADFRLLGEVIRKL